LSQLKHIVEWIKKTKFSRFILHRCCKRSFSILAESCYGWQAIPDESIT